MSPLVVVLGFAPWILYLVVVGLAGAPGVPLAAALVDSSVAHRPLLPFLLHIGVPVVLLIGAVRYTQRATGPVGTEAPRRSS